MKILSSFYLIILFSILVSLSACNTKTTYETVKTNQKYSLDLPSYLQQGTDLHEDATFQYQNLLKEFYVVVLEDDKTELSKLIDENGLKEIYPKNFTGYSNLLVEGFKENPDVKLDGKFTDWKIGTLDGKHFNLFAKLEDINIYYHYTLIEGKDTYYQVMQWTLADRKDTYKEEMDKIAKSFKEL
jgi:hypothetical protein